MKQISEKRGITLISLVITIIALLILAGVSIAMLTSDNVIITNAQKSKISTTFSTYKEEVELYKNSKIAENTNFLENTLEASKISLSYNTKKEEEKGNIKNIITTINDKDLEKFEIIKGKLLINTKDKNEIKVAQSLGIQVNPYDITEEGELLSSDGNLLLMDENGYLKIPDNVTKIGEGAFANLKGLKTIIIPGSVKEIGKNAFTRNSELQTVIMEEGVESIGQSAFSGCEKLKNVSMPESLKEMKSSAFQSDPTIEEIQIPSKIRKIDAYTFSGNAKLKKIILPESLEIINVGAFSYTGFEEIVIPEKINKIEVGAFEGNFELNNIIIRGENPQYIYENGMLMTRNKDDILFISDKYLKTINTFKIPDGITRFNINLNKYTNITKIIIPEKIENIAAHNFPDTINEIELSNTSNIYDINESKKILYRKDTKEIIKYLLSLKDKKDIHIAVPKVLGTEMEFFEIDSLDELKKSNMGILEPNNHRLVNVKDVEYFERLNPAENVVMILPGLAFDIERGRAGYGGGFYDKYLNRYGADDFLKIGICYDFQMQKYDTIKMEENDVKVDMTVTDRAYY